MPRIAAYLCHWRISVRGSSAGTDAICSPATTSQQSHTMLQRAHTKKSPYKKPLANHSPHTDSSGLLEHLRVPRVAQTYTPLSLCKACVPERLYLTTAQQHMEMWALLLCRQRSCHLSSSPGFPVCGREVQFGGRKEGTVHRPV